LIFSLAVRAAAGIAVDVVAVDTVAGIVAVVIAAA
jgi:hypothetical protein